MATHSCIVQELQGLAENKEDRGHGWEVSHPYRSPCGRFTTAVASGSHVAALSRPGFAESRGHVIDVEVETLLTQV